MYNGIKFDYEGFYNNEFEKKYKDKLYCYFNNINCFVKEFFCVYMLIREEKVIVWCVNDYFGMGCNFYVLKVMYEILDEYGVGVGGMRNIFGYNRYVVELEVMIVKLYVQEVVLVFSLCYVVNDVMFVMLGSKMLDCVILLDSLNYVLMIQGICYFGIKKVIFKYNDVKDLEEKFVVLLLYVFKIIVFEFVYSMCGFIGFIEEICDLVEKYGVIIFFDEVYVVGMYGLYGVGVVEYFDFEVYVQGKFCGIIMECIDIIIGILGKVYGCVGGYIVGSVKLVDIVCFFVFGFIFIIFLLFVVMVGVWVVIEYQMNYNGDCCL